MKRLYTLAILTLVATASFAQINKNYSRFNKETGQLVDPLLAPFYHGVASGDPLSNAVILWTRVTPETENDAAIMVSWKIAKDINMTQLVNSGLFLTDTGRDYTVKVDATNLQPGTTYYYQFNAFGKNSIIGRTRTTPTNNAEQLRFAVVSCSDFENGFFNSYKQIAQMKDLDAVLHLGDYQYEYVATEGTGGRKYEPANETIQLADYRIRHSFTKLDPDLQAAHQQHPWIVVWDDHESTNNSYRDGAENHTEGVEGVWNLRKSFSAKAYDEWMPTRLMDVTQPGKIFRTIKYGNLVDLIMLDTRIYDRDLQLAQAADGEANDPARKLIGPEQLAFLENALKTSTAKWKVLGQQVMFMQWNIVGKPLLDMLPGAPDLINMAINENGVAFNSDAWDGYIAERKRIFDIIENNNIDNVVVLTGDIHSTWAADITRDPYNPSVYNPLTGEGSMAVEFVTNSVTTSNLDLATSDDNAELLVRTGIMATNPHIKWNDLFKHGYSVIDFTTAKTQCDFYLTPIDASSMDQEREAGFSTADGENHITTEDAAAPGKENAPDLAPFPERTSSVKNNGNATNNLIVLGMYPNPVSQSAILQIIVNQPKANIQATIIDVTGKLVAKLTEQTFDGGVHSLPIDVSKMANGTYIIQLVTPEGISAKRFVVNK